MKVALHKVSRLRSGTLLLIESNGLEIKEGLLDYKVNYEVREGALGHNFGNALVVKLNEQRVA
jgi:hypothetical protein